MDSLCKIECTTSWFGVKKESTPVFLPVIWLFLRFIQANNISSERGDSELSADIKIRSRVQLIGIIKYKLVGPRSAALRSSELIGPDLSSSAPSAHNQMICSPISLSLPPSSSVRRCQESSSMCSQTCVNSILGENSFYYSSPKVPFPSSPSFPS